MNIQSFFATHPIFTIQEFDQFLADTGRTSRNNRKRLLGYYSSRGKLLLIRPGLYGTIPLGTDCATYPLDSYLIAAHLTPDSTIGYHSALAFHGVAHSSREERVIISKHPFVTPFRFRGITYRTSQPPKALIENQCEEFGVKQNERQGEMLRITDLERTLVDCLHRPRLGGDWEEVWRSYEVVSYLDFDAVVRYALLLENATTIASVGYFLQGQQDRWMIGQEVLDQLQTHRPRKPHYLGRLRTEHGRLVKEWNLVVPERIINRTWEESDEYIA